jgi:PAS domain S-box-containing protein
MQRKTDTRKLIAHKSIDFSSTVPGIQETVRAVDRLGLLTALRKVLTEFMQLSGGVAVVWYSTRTGLETVLAAGNNMPEDEARTLWKWLNSNGLETALQQPTQFFIPEDAASWKAGHSVAVAPFATPHADTTVFVAFVGADPGYPWRLARPATRANLWSLLERCVAAFVHQTEGALNIAAESEVQYGSTHQAQPAEWIKPLNIGKMEQRFEEFTKSLNLTDQDPIAQQFMLLLRAVQHTTDGIVITDTQLDEPGPHMLFVNNAFTRMTGYTADEMLGRSPRFLQGPLTDVNMLKNIRTSLEAGRAVSATGYNYKKDGTPFILEWTMTPIRNAKAKIQYWLASQRDVTDRVLEQQRQLGTERELSERVTEAQEGERRRVAQNLHDGLGQQLTLIKLQQTLLLQDIEKQQDKITVQKVTQQIHGLQTAIDVAIENLRDIARNLAPRVLERGGFFEGLQQLCAQSEVPPVLAIQAEFEGDDSAIRPVQGVVVYRILQELINNTMKHAGASQIHVRTRLTEGTLHFYYEDNGRGFDLRKASKGMGLGNVRARVALLNGSVTYETKLGKGFKAIIVLPGYGLEVS